MTAEPRKPMTVERALFHADGLSDLERRGAHHDSFMVAIITLADEVRRLRAENERLREALVECEAVMSKHIYPMPDRKPDHPWNVLQRARAALAGEKGTK